MAKWTKKVYFGVTTETLEVSAGIRFGVCYTKPSEKVEAFCSTGTRYKAVTPLKLPAGCTVEQAKTVCEQHAAKAA